VRQAPQTSRLRDWIASAPIFILVIGLVIGTVVVASAPSLHLEGVPQAGAEVMVHGDAFPGGEVQLWWDGSSKGMPAASVAEDGTFMVNLEIPAEAGSGTHRLDATAIGIAPGQLKKGTGLLATLQVSIAPEQPSLPPTPLPSLAPPSQPPSASASPSHSHTATPTPTPSATATPPPPGIDPVNCTGYPEPRLFLEVQSWWEGTNTSGGMAHVHAGTCFPLGQTVHGVMRLDTRITMHDSDGHLFALSTDLFTDGHGSGDGVYTNLDQDCTGTCQFWVTSYIDTRGAQDGWHEIRVKPRVRFSDGRRQMTSTGWVIRTENGNADGSSRSADGAVIGRGWYEGHGYQNPDIRNLTDLLHGPVSGVWSVDVRLAQGGQGFTPSFTAAYVDPDFHHGSEGIRLMAHNGAYVGGLAIDTRSLANGPHRLVLRVEAVHDGETLDGIMVFPFVVRN
jgi:hypothetical protein